jgi:hypothetical protein
MRRYGWSMLLGVSILTGCGGGGGGSGSVAGGSPLAGANVVAVSVGPGPPGTTGNINIPYASVTICQPGTATCATIDHLLIDTGSYGMRILASALSSSGLTLPTMMDPNNPNNTIAECIPFVDGYTWGPLATAKVEISGETASSISINILNDNGSYNPSVPTACTSLTTNQSLDSINAFNANGILGVGLFPDDCGAACADCNLMAGGCTDQNDVYYSCNATSNACNPTAVSESAQVRNPVTAFTSDNNGVILELPSIPSAGATSATGSLLFGIGTQGNNALGSAMVLTTTRQGFFTTMFNGQTLTNSFIDSGSNAYYFADSSLPRCSPSSGSGSSSGSSRFYCPPSPVTLSATNQGQNGTVSMVSFQIASLIPSSNYAINDVGGAAATSTGTDPLNNDFDFGLPFFYGRKVFIAIEGASAGSAVGPYYAY